MKVKSYNSLTELLTELEERDEKRRKRRDILLSGLFFLGILIIAGLLK